MSAASDLAGDVHGPFLYALYQGSVVAHRCTSLHGSTHFCAAMAVGADPVLTRCRQQLAGVAAQYREASATWAHLPRQMIHR